MSFDDDLAGKTVAVVGPAPPVGDQSDEIESHDLVVRCAWFGDDPAPGSGRRTDISYYNHALGRDIVAGKRTIPDGLLWACFKIPTIPLLAPNWRHTYPCKPKVRNPNMVPLATHDVLAAGAARVKVFGADFYLSPQPYADDPAKHRSPGLPASAPLGEIMTATLACHDQDVQRKFMRQLLSRHKRLTGDERFLRALAMDDDDYQAALVRLWPTATRYRTFRHVRTKTTRRVRSNTSMARAMDRRPEWEEVL